VNIFPDILPLGGLVVNWNVVRNNPCIFKKIINDIRAAFQDISHYSDGTWFDVRTLKCDGVCHDEVQNPLGKRP
jgi:hypothetical protein